MFRTILVPTDGSDAANEALEHALAMAEAFGASVRVLAVVDPGSNPWRFGVEEVDALNRAAERLVDDLVDAYDDRAVVVRGTVRRGRPYRAILEYADETDADVIVMGRTGDGGLSGVLLGSTTDRVLRNASVPVAVVDGRDGDDAK